MAETQIETNVKLTPEQVAELIWSMFDDEQAEMFHHLFKLAGDGHGVMMQFMYTRDKCEERQRRNPDDKALECFQYMFSSAYKYMGQ